MSQLNLENKVVFRNKETKSYSIDFHKDIKQRIEDIAPDAVYVFNSQPLILFFDFTIESSRDIDSLYKKVWSFDNTSIIFTIKNTGIEVFNALNYLKEENTLEPINLSVKKIEDLFNIWELESGNTWKWFQKEYIEKKKGKTHRKRVNERLFGNIKEVRNYLIANENLSDNESNSLILRIIFIRYLIDRKIKIDDTLIPGDVKNLNDRRRSFIQLIKQPQKLNELFTKLNNRFNGVLFKENDFILTQSQSDYLAGVFAGEIDGDDSLFKDFFFEIFDFSIIPVEVISGIYESLIDDEKRKLDSAVYTPSFLVDYILKDTVDEYLKNNSPEECTVFEVAVGSGIFLVQSLRRMIEKEIDLNGNKDKILFSEKIKSFAEKNLYGVDINPQALKVTCFSIYIALLDYLEPADINIYQFPKLIENNLFEANFFDTKHPFNEIVHNAQPKFILGNPPWQKDKSKEHLGWVNSTKTYSKKISGKLEIAKSFLLRTKEFMQLDTVSSLIVTSTVFYNISTTTKEFKTDFLTSFNLKKFFDLSPVRRLIFEKKNSPATVVTYSLSQNKDFNKNVVKHQSVKSNIFLKNFKILVIEKFDQKEILQNLFIKNDWMFKVALYGNTLDYCFLKKLNENVLRIIDIPHINFGAGIKSNKGNDHATDLIGLPLIENSDIQNFYTQITKKNKILNTDDVWYESGRKKELFFGDKILIKEQAKDESYIIASYTLGNSVYKNGVNGITSNKNIALKELYAILNSFLYEYYIYLTSGSWGTSTRPQIRLKEEFLSFPIVETDDETKNELVNLTDKLINPLKNFYINQSSNDESKFELQSPNQNLELPIYKGVIKNINEIINGLYGVKNHEKDLIDYVLNVSKYQFQESKQHLFTKNVDANITFLKKYADVYLSEFSDIYPDEFIQIEVYPLKYFIAMNFVMKEEKPDEPIIYSKNKDIESVLKTLANTLSISEIVNTHDTDKNLFIQKDIKGFEKDSFYIIKPNEYKCWHRAMAWYDVAEFKEAIQEAELNDFAE